MIDASGHLIVTLTTGATVDTGVARPDLSSYATDAELADAIATRAATGHLHDDRYVRTVNGTGPDGTGNVVVAGGGGGGYSGPPPVSGNRLFNAISNSTTASGTFGATTLYLAPYYNLSHEFQISGLALYVSTAGGAGTTAEMSIFEVTAGGGVGVRLAIGTVDVSSTGEKVLTLGAPLTIPAHSAILVGFRSPNTTLKISGLSTSGIYGSPFFWLGASSVTAQLPLFGYITGASTLADYAGAQMTTAAGSICPKICLVAA